MKVFSSSFLKAFYPYHCIPSSVLCKEQEQAGFAQLFQFLMNTIYKPGKDLEILPTPVITLRNSVFSAFNIF
jgi:hypothetical protein